MAIIHPKRVVVNNKYYTLTTWPLGRIYDGLAENHPKTRNKHIWINESLRGIELLDTLIHEVTHAGLHFLTEETVTQFANDLAKILWDLGYRSEDLGDEE
jgi:hypothetical protein